jgi:hypothetical protein
VAGISEITDAYRGIERHAQITAAAILQHGQSPSQY